MLGPDQVLARVLIDIGILIATAQLLRLLLAPLRQPDVIAYVLAGFVLGPSLLGNLPGDPSGYLFPEEVRAALSTIGSLGLVVFAFAIGLGLDLGALRRQSRAVLDVSVGALVAPLVAGGVLALALYPAHHEVGGAAVPRLAFVLFFATAMAVTAFPVLVAIVDERGVRDSPLGRLAVSSAAVQDAVGWVLLAVALAVFSGGGSGPLRIVVEALGFLVALGLARPLLRAALASPALGGSGGEVDALALALGFAAACAGATEAIGLHLVVGAFAAGVAYPRGTGPGPARPALVAAVMPITMALLMPIYFLGPGLGVDVGAIGPGGFVELAAIFLVACASKLVGGTLGARRAGLPWPEARVLGVLLNTRGLMELVVLTVGYTEGVLDRPLFSELVLVALATTMMTGPLLDLLRRGGVDAAGAAPPRSGPVPARSAPSPAGFRGRGTSTR
jgi:Kef-type K+ transport system membrane component KefB